MVKINNFDLLAFLVLVVASATTVVQSLDRVANQKHSFLRNNDNSRQLGLFDAIEDIFGGENNDNKTAEDGEVQSPDDEDIDGIFEDIVGLFDGSNETDTENDNNETDINEIFEDIVGLFDGDNETDTDNDNNETDFGEWLGDFGDMIGNITDTIFNGTSNGTFFDDMFDDVNLTDGGIFDSIFNGTIGGIFDDIFNMTDDNNVTDIFDNILDTFKNMTSNLPQLTPFNGFLSEWTDEIPFSKTITCENADGAPECYDPFGQEGFWVCRTLRNPFTGTASSKNFCISKGQFLTNNDDCGCCIPEDIEEAVPTCPKVCECSCTLDNGDDGVLVSVKSFLGNDTICVDPRWAVSSVGILDQVTCDDSCNK